MKIKRFNQLNEGHIDVINPYKEAQEELDELYTKFIDNVNDVLIDFEGNTTLLQLSPTISLFLTTTQLSVRRD